MTPVGRLAHPHEIAAVIAFLASEESSFVVGQFYNPDPPWDPYAQPAPDFQFDRRISWQVNTSAYPSQPPPRPA